MTDAHVADILALPVEERLRLAELIRASLAANPTTLPLSDAHIAVIEARLAEDRRDPADVLTMDEVLNQARRGA